MVERLSSKAPRLIFEVNNGEGKFQEIFNSKLSVVDALSVVSSVVKRHDVVGIGHRVVHGGVEFDGPAVIDGNVKEKIRDLVSML